jgi:hypothetical protein
MALRNRSGNSVFFIGLVLLVPAAMAFFEPDANLELIGLAIGCLSLLFMAIGAWLWTTAGGASEHSELSTLSPKAKLVAGIPGLIFLLLSMNSTNGVQGVQGFLAMGLLAVAIAGGVELVIDRKFPNAKASWDQSHPLKKVAWSTIVIVVAFLAFGAIAMLIGRASL